MAFSNSSLAFSESLSFDVLTLCLLGFLAVYLRSTLLGREHRDTSCFFSKVPLERLLPLGELPLLYGMCFLVVLIFFGDYFCLVGEEIYQEAPV